METLNNRPSLAKAMEQIAKHEAQSIKIPVDDKSTGQVQPGSGGGSQMGLGVSVVLMMLAVVTMSMKNMNASMSTSSKELDLNRAQAKDAIIAGQKLANKPLPTDATATDGASAELAQDMIEATEFEAAGQNISSSISLQSTNLSNTAEEYMAQYLIGLSAIQLFLHYAVTR